MDIGVVVYNFEHKKTQEGLLNLFLNGYKVECILAADPVQLDFYQSKIRITPKELQYTHPHKIADVLKIPYYVVPHNSKECINLVKKHKLDLGIILGARILKKNIFYAFKVGIINMHPGLIPQNRGLDNIKWAIIKGLKQGVTVHMINEKIDHGKIILQKDISIYQDDTLLDIFLRIQNQEQVLMIESLKILENGKRNFIDIGDDGNYFQSVTPDIEKSLFNKFDKYKKMYGESNV